MRPRITLENGEINPKVGNGTVDDAAECIDHIVKVAGIDHVGIGSDFDGIPSVPRGLEDVSKMPNSDRGLAETWIQGKRYSEDHGRQFSASDSGGRRILVIEIFSAEVRGHCHPSGAEVIS